MQTIVIPSDIEYKHHLDFCEALTEKIPYFRVKVREFVNNTLDMVMTEVKHSLDKVTDSEPRELTEEELEQKRLDNIERASRRAKQIVHHAIRQIQADHMLTLTTRDCFTNRKMWFEIYTRFVRLVRTKDLIQTQSGLKLVSRSEKRHWPYVAVPELQQRGAYHMHIACVGKQDLKLLRACWYVALGGDPNDTGVNTLGAVNVRYEKKRFSGLTDVHKVFKLVGYLTKYMSKSFENDAELGQKRYSTSREIPKPKISYMYLTFLADFDQLPPMATKGDTTPYFALDAFASLYKFARARGYAQFEPWNREGEVFTLRCSL